MLKFLRLAGKGKTVATVAALTTVGIAVQALVERYLPGQAEAVKGTTAGLAVWLAALGGPLRQFAEHFISHLSSLDASIEANELTAAQQAETLEHNRDFNHDIAIAFGRTLAQLLRVWAAERPGMIRTYVEELADRAAEQPSGGAPPWLAAAEAVGAEIREETLRDLCLNQGHLSPGDVLLPEETWADFLKELGAGLTDTDALRTYSSLWRPLSIHLNREFPSQFYIDMKAALADPRHAKAWAGMQFRIEALILERINAAELAAQRAATEAHTAAAQAQTAGQQAAAGRAATLRLASQIADDMRQLWRKVDQQEQRLLGALYARFDKIADQLDALMREVRAACDAAERSAEYAQRAADTARDIDDRMRGMTAQQLLDSRRLEALIVEVGAVRQHLEAALAATAQGANAKMYRFNLGAVYEERFDEFFRYCTDVEFALRAMTYRELRGLWTTQKGRFYLAGNLKLLATGRTVKRLFLLDQPSGIVRFASAILEAVKQERLGVDVRILLRDEYEEAIKPEWDMFGVHDDRFMTFYRVENEDVFGGVIPFREKAREAIDMYETVFHAAVGPRDFCKQYHLFPTPQQIDAIEIEIASIKEIAPH